MTNRAALEKVRVECEAVLAAQPDTKPTAVGLRFRCRVHPDESPSADWNSKGVWICRSCGASGGIVEMAKLLGIAVPEKTEREDPLPVTAEEVERRHAELMANAEALDWLWRHRRISRIVTEAHKLGLVHWSGDPKIPGGSAEFFYPIRCASGWFASARRYRPHMPAKRKRIWLPAFAKAATPGEKLRMPLWGAVEAVESKASRILAFEGEDKAMAVQSLGLTDTACISGTGGCGYWPAAWGGVVTGKHLVYIADTDTPGIAAIGKVAAWSRAAKVASFRVVYLPGLVNNDPNKKDVTDWLTRLGGTAEKLEAEIAAAKAWESSGSLPGVVAATAEVDVSEHTTTPEPPSAPEEEFELTDLGNARLFHHLYGANLRYVFAQNCWYAYDETMWKENAKGEVERLAQTIPVEIQKESRRCREFAARLRKESRHEEAQKAENRADELWTWAKKSQSNARINAIIDLAKSMVEIDADTFDWNDMVLNCLNCTIDLVTGLGRPHRREDYITKKINLNYDADADCPEFKKFVMKIMGENVENARCLLRCLGYSITGSTKEQVMFFCYGPTAANGKSKLLECVSDILGDYAGTAPQSLLEEKHSPNHPTELAMMRGKRMVIATETSNGKRMAESLMKQLTGGDKVAARRCFENFWEYRPRQKIWQSGNHRLVIRADDAGVRRRLFELKFNVHFWDRDKGETGLPEHEMDKSIPDKLRAEHVGILALLVRYCMEWQRLGLAPTPEILESTVEYTEEMDSVGDWVRECCVRDPYEAMPIAEAYRLFLEWAEKTRSAKVSKNSFSSRLLQLGFDRYKDGVGNRLIKRLKLRGSDIGGGGAAPDPEA